MVIGEIMTKNPVTAKVTDSVGDIMSVLYELDARHLPIVDGAELKGIISDRDLRPFTVAAMVEAEEHERARERMNTPISEVMAADLVTVLAESDVSEAIDIMLEERIGAVPVVDSSTSELVGILSYVDVLRALRSLV